MTYCNYETKAKYFSLSREEQGKLTIKAQRIRRRAIKIARNAFNDNNLQGFLRPLNAYNKAGEAIYWGMEPMSPGDWLNFIMEEIIFDQQG